MSRGKLMLVEDDPLNAFLLQDIVRDLGYEVEGVAGSLSWAVELATAKADSIVAAIVDINLNGVISYSVAEALVERDVPVIFVTGYATAENAPPSVAHLPVVRKPYNSAQIAKALGDVIDRKSNK